MLTTPLNQASKHLVLTNAQFCLALFGLLIIAVMSIYITGYLYGVMHNSFVESDESILPKFDTSWFRVFFKGFPQPVFNFPEEALRVPDQMSVLLIGPVGEAVKLFGPDLSVFDPAGDVPSRRSADINGYASFHDLSFLLMCAAISL